jgi:hypothetical protein
MTVDLSQYKEYARRGEALRQIIGERLYRDVLDLAGSLTAELYLSVDRAAAFLDHASPQLRLAAIITLVFHWSVPPGTRIAEKIRSMARCDTDTDVRREALSGGACIYAGTDDIELGELLARKVLDESSDVDSRTEAYHSLRRLQHKRLPLKLSFAFPDEVDWHYVARFLDKSRTPQPADPLETFADAYLTGVNRKIGNQGNQRSGVLGDGDTNPIMER